MRTYLLAVLAVAACGTTDQVITTPGCDAWHQWGNNGSHAGKSCVRGQPLATTLANVVYDPFIDLEVADAQGNLVVHYQAPLIDGDDLYMMIKRGTYTPCKLDMKGNPSCFEPDELYRRNTQIWAEQHFAIGASGGARRHRSFDRAWT